jgi:Holliday junction resolvase RusA-like endonuclease
MYTPPKTAEYELLVAKCGGFAMQAQCYADPFKGNIGIEILVILPVPNSWSKKKRAEALIGDIKPVSKPDLDNIIKSIGDGLNGIVWEDDSQICVISARKQYGEEPLVNIKIESEEQNGL